MATSEVYREEQRLRQVWLWVVIVVLAALAWWAVVAQIVRGVPFDDRPATNVLVWIIFVLVGMGLPLFGLLARMIVTVSDREVWIRWIPLYGRRIPLSEIRECRAKTYRPIRDYGGWGVRWMPGRGMALNVSGNRGVLLTLANGKKLMIGSQRPEELAAAIGVQSS